LPAAISADITSSPAGKKRGFCRLRWLTAPPGNFSGHYFVARPLRGPGKKAWFLPAALADGACGASVRATAT
jgi:hypothetical protein